MGEWGEVEKATTAARYLHAEINLMRRVMQEAGTWDQFCADYAAYTERRKSSTDARVEDIQRRIDSGEYVPADADEEDYV